MREEHEDLGGPSAVWRGEPRRWKPGGYIILRQAGGVRSVFLLDIWGLRGRMSFSENTEDRRENSGCEEEGDTCYVEAKPESGYIWKLYKQKLGAMLTVG